MADELEAFVVEAVLLRLDSPDLAAALQGSTDGDAQAQVDADAAATRLDELARAYANDLVTMPEWLAAREPLEQRLVIAKRRLARQGQVHALDGHVGNATGLRERWASLPLTRQRAIVAALIDHLVIGPGRRGFNRFDASRAEPVWRV